MLKTLGVIAIFAALAAPLGAVEPPPAAPPASPALDLVGRYVSAVETQRSNARPVSMEVDIDAQLPRLKKQGRLHALRFITRVGEIFYRAVKFDGDNTVKKEVIGRFLRAELEARSEYAGSIAITPQNYKFKYKGTTDYSGRKAYILQLSPRDRRVGLFKGELWIDADTYLPLREWGELVKNPSVFLKRVYFVRDYFILDGTSIPRRLISDVDTRIVGKAQLTVWFDKFEVGEQRLDAASLRGGGTHIALADGGQQ